MKKIAADCRVVGAGGGFGGQFDEDRPVNALRTLLGRSEGRREGGGGGGSTKSTKQAKPQGGAAFCCPATPATSSAISRFLFEGGFSFRVPLFASGYLHFVPVPLRSGWRQNDRHSLADTDLCLNYFPLRSPNSKIILPTTFSSTQERPLGNGFIGFNARSRLRSRSSPDHSALITDHSALANFLCVSHY